MRPDICNNPSCSSFGGDYCPECSHGWFSGEGFDKKGKQWRWRFNTWFGPTFLKRDGVPLIKQPTADRHPALITFKAWLERIRQQSINS